MQYFRVCAQNLNQCVEVVWQNEQEDGDGLMQNIVTNFGEGSRSKGLTEGWREFIVVDNESSREQKNM